MLLLSMAAALAITKPDVASGFATRAFTAPSGLVGPVAGLRPGYAISARMPRCDWAHFLGRMSVRQQAGNLGSTTSLTGLGVGGSAVPPKQAITGTRMMTTASMPIGISMERLTNQYVLLSMATICLLWITTSSQAGLEPLFVNGILAPFLKNVPIAIACFGSADIVTQAVGAARNSAGAKLRWDKRQTLAACCVGVVLNAFGLTVWLHYLNELIPMAAIALPGLEGVMNLLIKAFTHRSEPFPANFLPLRGLSYFRAKFISISHL